MRQAVPWACPRDPRAAASCCRQWSMRLATGDEGLAIERESHGLAKLQIIERGTLVVDQHVRRDVGGTEGANDLWRLARDVIHDRNGDVASCRQIEGTGDEAKHAR